MSSTHRAHYFHLVWSTKMRQNTLLPKMQDGLYPYMKGIANRLKSCIVDIGGTSNHVHLLLQVGSPDNFSAIVRELKTASTLWLKKEFLECKDFSWQDGYGSFTVSISQVDTIRRYIQNQEAHHSKQSFEDEYIKFLELNNVEYNPKYVFE